MRPGRKIAQTGLKSSSLLDRTDYLQTGMNSERDECKHNYTNTFQTGLLSAVFLASEERMLTKNGGQGE
jgi:hypothetical protein